MTFKSIVVALCAFAAVGCGSSGDLLSAVEAGTASLSAQSLLKVECLRTLDNARGTTVRKRVLLSIQGKNVNLEHRLTTLTASNTSSQSETFTGTVNTVFDGTVVKKTHARVLLASAQHTTGVGQQANKKSLRYALIHYTQGKITVLDPDSQPLLVMSNCRTSEAAGLPAEQPSSN